MTTIEEYKEYMGESFRAVFGLIVIWGLACLLICLVGTPFTEYLLYKGVKVDRSALYWTLYGWLFWTVSVALVVVMVLDGIGKYKQLSSHLKTKKQKAADKDLEEFIEFCKKR